MPKPRAFLLFGFAALVLALVGAGSALADDGGIVPLQPHSPNTGAVRDTYWLILAITGVIFVIVEGALILFVVRYRRGRRSRTTEGPQIRGHTNLEIGWTVVPVLIVAAIIGYVFAKLPDVTDVPKASAADTLNVRVEAHQFYWLFRYPGGQVSIDTLQVPVSRPVRLTVVGIDVEHSWWVPALSPQVDAIPGRTNYAWFRADKQGSYVIRCAQLCGLLHARMSGTVKVVDGGSYAAFLAAHAPSSQTVAAETFTGVCSKCHGFKGKGDYGPALQNRSFETRDITDVLRHGRRAMPAVGSTWSQAQITAVVAYLKRTKGGASGG